MDLQTVTQWYNFTGRTVVITGGAGILGGEMACMLVGCGANVAILDRDPSLADRLMDRLGCGPGCATVVYGNVLKIETLVKAEEIIRVVEWIDQSQLPHQLVSAGQKSRHCMGTADGRTQHHQPEPGASRKFTPGGRVVLIHQQRNDAAHGVSQQPDRLARLPEDHIQGRAQAPGFFLGRLAPIVGELDDIVRSLEMAGDTVIVQAYGGIRSYVLVAVFKIESGKLSKAGGQQ